MRKQSLIMKNGIKYISRVEINGLWGNIDLNWDLNEDVNILSGINGSGKSTILDCICGIIVQGEIHHFIKNKVSGIKIIFNDQQFLSFSSQQVIESFKNLELKAKKNQIYKNIINDLKENHPSDLNKIKNISFQIGSTSFDNMNLSLSELNKKIRIDIISTFDNSIKEIESVKKLTSENVKTELDWELFNLQKEYLDYQLNIGKKAFEALSNSKIESNNNEILKIKQNQERFLEIIGGLFKQTGKKINTEKNEISFLLGEVEINLYELSYGEKQLLLILLTVLVQDGRNSIMFMDEPEISLHFDWQKDLINYIVELNPNCQLIIATHSPALIMNGWLNNVSDVRDLVVQNQKD